MSSGPARRLRCAVYTRKSTEEGLDQAFNSLDAQREACAAYVLSQRHEGWILLPEAYDDGGFTGGNMDRPGLQRLLDGVRTGRIDVVVVYKVDRLTRSLADFAKIVEVLDAVGASFVSVTQAFNTTTSMGRLTLNVLLSFAQFEREVISERIRDKVAASKAKGMWMGGPLPLGYKVEERKLIIVPEEAERVREIMQRYLAAPSVPELLEQLRAAGVVSKQAKMRDGSLRGGTPFRRGALYHLLSNRIYVGEIVRRGKAYPGQHQAIVESELFEAVQRKLAERTNPRGPVPTHRMTSLLAGMIRDAHGRPMSPCHTSNHGKRYRYYASNLADGSKQPRQRLPAGDLDAAVVQSVANLLGNATRLRRLASSLEPWQQMELVSWGTGLARDFTTMSTVQRRSLLQSFCLEVQVLRDRANAALSSAALLRLGGFEVSLDARIELDLPAQAIPWGHEQRLRLAPPAGEPSGGETNLAQLIARGFAARDRLLAMSDEEIAATPGTQLRHLERIAKLAYLAPDIVSAILAGKQPCALTARRLARIGSLPLCWKQQRVMLGFDPR